MSFNKIKTGIRVYQEQGLSGMAKALFSKGEEQNYPDSVVGETWTEYMSWLTFANAGMLTRGNVYCMDYAVRKLPSAAPIVEIGSFCGLSTNLIIYLKEKHEKNNTLVTCDKWIFEGSESGGKLGDSKNITHEEYRQFVKDTFLRNTRMFSRHDLPFTIEVFSDEFFNLWAVSEKCHDVFGRKVQLGGPISFCYIDGNHSYEFARRDFENCDKFLESGGFILFDDSADGSKWDVCRVVQEVLQSGDYDLVTKNPNYFFRKK